MRIFASFSFKSILHQSTCPHTLQQNGIVERKHQSLLNIARALLFQASLPIHFWADAILTATYILNRVPTSVLHNISPYKALYHKTPSYHFLKVFGCLCFASTLSHNRKKFEPRARTWIFVGYPSGVKGYKVYDL